MFPVLIVAGLMALTVVGAFTAALAVTRVTLVPGLQSVSVKPGQTVEIRLPPGATWVGGGMLSGTAYAAGAPTSGSAPVTFPAPPTVLSSFVASWTSGGTEQGAVLLIVPPGQSGSSTVTDPTAVAFAQTTLMAIGQKGTIAGLTFGQAGSSQTFAQGLAVFQTWCNGAQALGSSGVQIRTDGVLDYATLSLLASAASGLF